MDVVEHIRKRCLEGVPLSDEVLHELWGMALEFDSVRHMLRERHPDWCWMSLPDAFERMSDAIFDLRQYKIDRLTETMGVNMDDTDA